MAESQKHYFALCKQLKTSLSHESACSVKGPRKARMLACKSTYMTWPKAQKQIHPLELSSVQTIKNFTYPRKRLFSVWITHSQNASVQKHLSLHVGWKPMGRFCVWNFALHTQLETLLPRQSDCSAYGLRTAKMLAGRSPKCRSFFYDFAFYKQLETLLSHECACSV